MPFIRGIPNYLSTGDIKRFESCGKSLRGFNAAVQRQKRKNRLTEILSRWLQPTPSVARRAHFAESLPA